MRFPILFLLLIVSIAMLTGACAPLTQHVEPVVPNHILPSYPSIDPPRVVMPMPNFYPLCDLEECVDAC